MANSIPDIYINGSDWVDVYSTTGIAVGTPLLIQNKSSNALLLYISATKPTSTTDGFALGIFDSVSVDASESGCWIRGSGSVNVQRA